MLDDATKQQRWDGRRSSEEAHGLSIGLHFDADSLITGTLTNELDHGF